MNISFRSLCLGLFHRLWHSRRLSRPRQRTLRLSIAESLEARALLSSTPAMVSDLNPGAASSDPAHFLAIGSTIYFTADDGIHGQELWTSNATTASTRLVADLCPGSDSSFASNFTNVNGTLYFSANDGVHGNELWKTNPVGGGTSLVTDIWPGASGFVQNLTNVNGTLYFTAHDGVHGSELWKSNGTPAGTVMVKDISQGGSSYPDNLTNINGKLYFSADDGVNGRELWSSDGTVDGTTLVKDIAPGDSWGNSGASQLAWYGGYYGGGYGGGGGYYPPVPNSSSPDAFTAFKGMLFFVASDTEHGTRLWKSDGTPAGTVSVADMGIENGTESLTELNGKLYFSALDSAGGYELWSSDGTITGTALVSDIRPGGESSNVRHLTNANGTLYFSADDGVHGPELWMSNGTPAGTALVSDIRPGSAGSDLRQLTNVGGTLYFSADDGVHGPELWKSIAAPAGTRMVKDLFPGGQIDLNGDHPFGSSPGNLTSINGILHFTASDGVHGAELWALNGVAVPSFDVSVSPETTTAGAATSVSVTARNSDGTINTAYRGKIHMTSSDPQAVLSADYTFTAADLGTHTFAATLKTAGYQSIAANDTQAPGVTGAESSIAVHPAAASMLTVSGFPAEITAGIRGPVTLTLTDPYGNMASGYRGTVHFSSSDSEAMLPADYMFTSDDAGQRTFSLLLKTAGVQSFTVADVSSGSLAATQRGITVTAGGPLPEMVADIVPGSSQPRIGDLVAIGSKVYFTAEDDIHGRELWTSDGTAAGTRMVADINSDESYWWDSSSISYLTNVNGTLFFTANDGVHGQELWTSDGTAAGTRLVKNICPDSDCGYGSYPEYLTNVNGTLYFVADDGVHGPELWKSDGTAAGTRLVKDIYPGDDDYYYPRYLTNVNGMLYFAADNGASGYELWKSDGTSTGTKLVKDIFPGRYFGYPNSSYPCNLTNVNGTLYFVADDGVHGPELWKSDGSPAGTILVKDILADGEYGNAYPADLTNVNGTLFFTADDGIHGRELWKSDGTPAGTRLVLDLFPGLNDFYSSDPMNLTSMNGTLFFSAADGERGRELWKSDGTDSGTMLVKDINTGGELGSSWYDSNPRDLIEVNGMLFFTAADGDHETELWKSDGTAAGTVMVMDIHPGPEYGYFRSEYPGQVTNANGIVFFTADDGIHGEELWALNTLELAPETPAPAPAAAASSLAMASFPATTTAGSPGGFTITARNADGTTCTDYVGTIHFSSTDPQAVLPADYTFTAADRGTRTFTANLKTAGTQSITVNDTLVPGVDGAEAGTVVTPAAASTMSVSGFPSTTTAGAGGEVTVTLKDPYGNIATGYLGKIHFSCTDPQAVRPPDYTFTAADQGSRTFTASLKTAGLQSLSVNDTLSPEIAGAESEISVTPAAARSLTVSGFPSTTTAGDGGTVTVTLRDLYGNIASGYTGTVQITSSDSKATLPANYSFTALDAGQHTFAVTLKTAGTRKITVADAAQPSLVGRLSGIIVNAAAASQFVVSSSPSAGAGLAFNLTLKVRDVYGNLVKHFAGTIGFSSSDETAQLPANYTFTAVDQGVRIFTGLVLRRTGRQTITITDTTNASLSSIRTVKVV